MDYKHVAAAEDLLITSAKRARHSNRWLLPGYVLVGGIIGSLLLKSLVSSTQSDSISEPLVTSATFPLPALEVPKTTINSPFATMVTAITYAYPAMQANASMPLMATTEPNKAIAHRHSITLAQTAPAKSYPSTKASTAAVKPVLIAQAKPSATTKPVKSAPEWQTVTIRKGDTLGHIFSRIGLSSQQLQSLLALKEARQALPKLKLGNQIKFLIGNDKQLQGLSYVIDDIATLQVSRSHEQLQAQILRKKPVTRVSYAGLTVTRSLAQAAQRAQLHPKLLQELHLIFKDKANLSKIRVGDKVKILYQEDYVGEKKVATGNILAASLSLGGKIYRAVRFDDAKGHVAYYTPEGLSLRKGFIRYPVQFTHISSGFSTHRFHPVTHRYAPHQAIDFAAPQGTPVKASGDGKIAYAGPRGGYGNMVLIRHDNKYETLYAHLNRFAKDIRVGTSVQEGQIIGYVGMTGIATGPHLHYEFHINGVRHNPLTVDLPSAAPLSRLARAKFIPQARRLMAQLEMNTQRVQLASNEQTTTHMSS